MNITRKLYLIINLLSTILFHILMSNESYTRSFIHFFRAPVCMLCYCQRKITPADLSVHCPTVGFGKDISSRFSRELFRVYLENTSSAGKKPIRVRWYQTSKYWVSAFCSFSFHSGTVGIPLRWVFIIFLDHLGLKRGCFFFTDGYVWSSYFLTDGFI